MCDAAVPLITVIYRLFNRTALFGKGL